MGQDLTPTKGFLLWEARSGSHERIPSGPGSATNTRSNQARIWLRYQCQIQSGQDLAPLLMPDPIRPRPGSATNARSNHAKTWLRYQCQIQSRQDLAPLPMPDPIRPGHGSATSARFNQARRFGSHERIPFVRGKIWVPRKDSFCGRKDLGPTKGFLLCGAKSDSHERIPFVGGKIWFPRKDSFCGGQDLVPTKRIPFVNEK